MFTTKGKKEIRTPSVLAMFYMPWPKYKLQKYSLNSDLLRFSLSIMLYVFFSKCVISQF